MSNERNILDYVYVLVKWRRLIVCSVIAVGVAAAGISLVLPKEWTVQTTLLPPEEDGGQLGMTTLMTSHIPPNLRMFMGRDSSSERLLTILGSRRVLGAVVERFDLVQEYGVRDTEIAIQQLRQSVGREFSEDGALHVQVTASNPELAAALANALTAELDAVNRYYKSLQARSARKFLEERMEIVRAELREAGEALRRFQQDHGVVDVKAQTAAVVDVIKGVAQELALREVELDISEHLLGQGHERLEQVALHVAALQRHMQRLVGNVESDGADPAKASVMGSGPTLMKLPALAQEFARLTVELQVKEAVVGYLGTRLEETRFREARDTPTILVLDPALPPAYRSAPRRTIIVLGAVAISLLTSVLLAFALESMDQVSARHKDRIQAIRALLRKDG